MSFLFVLSIFYMGVDLATIENGIDNVPAESMIVGGEQILVAQAPYQVSLRLIVYDNIQFGSGFFCGGSLISLSVVLTAAHCMYNKTGNLLAASDIQVVGGHASLTDRDSNTLVSAVSSLKVHEFYKNGVSYAYDIAVLKLQTAVSNNKTATVRTIELPNDTYPVGSTCLISGWGATKYGGATQQYLHQAYIPVNNVAICNQPQYLNGTVEQGMFCAGSFLGGVDTCQGDSGGPLQCNNILVGITSHGYKCALPRYPGIYTDVYYFRDWILKNNSVTMVFSIKMLFSSVAIALSQWRIYVEAWHGGWQI